MKPATAERRQRQMSTEHMLKDVSGQIDPESGRRIVKIFSGGWHLSTGTSEMLATILGSCVSCCMRDPALAIGGMNHFLLPGEGAGDMNSASARYGVYAMERLINAILQQGGRKERLEVKVFGGGNVTANSARIGSKNAAFVKDFLKREGITIAAQDLEGDLPRRLHYFPDTGRVMMRRLSRKEDLVILDSERDYAKSLTAAPAEGDVELFG